MKRLVLAATIAVAAASTVSAIEPTTTGTWNCAKPGFSGKYAYCGANITSGTTSTQLGSVNIDPSKQIFLAHRATTPISPTFNFVSGGATVYSLTVSASSTPQVISIPVPYFQSINVSLSVPSTLSATNALSATIIENAVTVY